MSSKTPPPRSPELSPEVGYIHSYWCPYCFLSTHIHAFHNYFISPPPKTPETCTEKEKKAFIDAQKKKGKEYWVVRYKLRRWALVSAGAAITGLTAYYVRRLYKWIHKRELTVLKKFGHGEVPGGGWTMKKDGMLRVALMVLLSSPCACFVGFLVGTWYYWKDKRDRKAKKATEKARAQEQGGPAANTATSNHDSDPRLIDVKYEDLQRMQKVEVMIGSTSIDAPAQVIPRQAHGRDEGWTGSMASWWSGVTAVYKGGYDGRVVRRQNWEEEQSGIELEDRRGQGAQAHSHVERPELRHGGDGLGIGVVDSYDAYVDSGGGGGGGSGGMGRRERPVTEWPSLTI